MQGNNSKCKRNFNMSLFHLLFSQLFHFSFQKKANHVNSWNTQPYELWPRGLCHLRFWNHTNRNKKIKPKSSTEKASYKIIIWVRKLEVKTRHSFLGLDASLQAQEFPMKRPISSKADEVLLSLLVKVEELFLIKTAKLLISRNLSKNSNCRHLGSSDSWGSHFRSGHWSHSSWVWGQHQAL